MGPRMREDNGRGSRGGARFPNRPYEGLVAQHITGDHKGRPYGRNGRGRGMGPRIREDNGKGERMFTPIPRLHEGRL